MSFTVADDRGRVTVAEKGQTYKVTVLDAGAILLEPAEVLTRAELALRLDPAFADQVADSVAHPERLVPHRRRSPRQTRG
ncbi:MAG: hypothetical protein FWD11_03225 [Micrococcales bacterium]|nr:hypothetical protein [Micrococcales bacterium]